MGDKKYPYVQTVTLSIFKGRRVFICYRIKIQKARVSNMNELSKNNDENLYILNGPSISKILNGKEKNVMDIIQTAYEDHHNGKSVLPHSVFLKFPDNLKDRIIGLPGYISGDHQIAGIKWISSFPDNVQFGIDRASAILILNSMKSGRPKAVLESSLISAKRTAASAALAVTNIAPKDFEIMGLVGCGLIGFEIVRFVMATNSSVNKLLINDLSLPRAEYFRRKCEKDFPLLDIEFVSDVNEILSLSLVTAFATTASEPYVHKISECKPNSLILNISLRDIAPEIVICSDNIVDDPDHVCRENTSIHLAEKITGDRNFIRGTIAEICLGKIKPHVEQKAVTIFSPFGLGVLDLVLGDFVLEEAISQNLGLCMDSFFPEPWYDSQQVSI